MELNKVAESIGAINTPTVGIAGEVRCVVTKADGTVKTDTGYQKNLILNQGLDFFGGGKGTAINASCAIGSGNSAPAITQTVLDAFITLVSGTDVTSSYAYTNTGDGMYRMWEQQKYRFTGLNNVNISEVGLISTGTNSTNNYLTTRALIKDSSGTPTSISVLTGETLDIYYKIHKVIDVSDKSFVINVLDGNGGSVPYNIIIRSASVGSNLSNNVSSALGTLSYPIVSASDLSNITSSPSGATGGLSSVLSEYTPSSYTRGLTLTMSLNESNIGIRTISSYTGEPSLTFLPFQMRFGRVSDDAPLTKTANDTLSIPLEFSWGRYEGVL